MRSSYCPAWFRRLKAEKYLGVEPLFLVNHPHGEELIEQAWDAIQIDNHVHAALLAKDKLPIIW